MNAVQQLSSALLLSLSTVLSSPVVWAAAPLDERNSAKNLVIDRQGIKVWTYQVAGNPSFNYRATTTVQSNLVGTVAAIMDTPYLKQWVPHTQRVDLLESDEKAGTFTMRMEIDFPFPLNDRDVVFSGTIKQQPNGTIVIENRATTHPQAPVRSGFLRVTRYEGSWVLRPIDATHTEVTTTGYADPAGILPISIVNMFVQQQPYLMLRNMKSVVQSAKYQRAQLYQLKNLTP